MTQRPNDPAWSPAPMAGAPDPERLAALLDERLSGAERDELLARLADSDEDLAVFGEAAAIQRELEAEDEASASAVPDELARRRAARPARGLDRRWMAAAAVVAGLALLPLAWRASQSGPVREPAQAVAMLEDPAAGLPPGWEVRPWSDTRGGGNAADDALSVQLGAFMVDLEIAVRARDADATQLLSDRIALSLSEASTSGTLAARYFSEITQSAGAPPAELLPALEEASDAAAMAVDADRFALGAWMEAARFAAARRDAAFFREARTRRTLARAEELVEDDEEARTALAAIRASLDAESILWPELETGLNRLMRAVG